MTLLRGFTVGVTAEHGCTAQIEAFGDLGATVLHGPTLDSPSLLSKADTAAACRKWSATDGASAARGLVGAVAECRVDAITFTAPIAVKNFMVLASSMRVLPDVISASATTTAAFCLTPATTDIARGAGLERVECADHDELESLVALVAKRLENSATELELAGQRVLVRGRELTVGAARSELLTRRERRLLSVLASRPGVVFSKAALLAEVWRDETADEHVVEVTIGRLRRRLGTAGHGIETVMRRGYRMSVA